MRLALLPALLALVAGPSAVLARIHHVFVIMMENKDYAEVIGNASAAPYINQVLLPRASYTSHYYSPVNHGLGVGQSLPNYIWLEAGDNLDVVDDHGPFGRDGKPVNSRNANHFTAELERAGVSWRAYLEDYAGGCPLRNRDHYAVRHDPFVYFQDFTGDDPVHPAATCGPPHLAPMSQLPTDLRSGAVPAYSYIVPNVCHDMHDDCIGSGANSIRDEVVEGDTWLSRTVPAILTSAAYRRGGALFVLWDEGDLHDGGPLPFLLLSPFAKGTRGGFEDTSFRYSHAAALGTWEEIFHVAPLAQRPVDWAPAVLSDGARADATDMSALFTPPDSGANPVWASIIAALVVAAIAWTALVRRRSRAA